MANVASITGVRSVAMRLARRSETHRKGVHIGLIRAALFIQRESQKVVPVLTGNLKGSAFTRQSGAGIVGRTISAGKTVDTKAADQSDSRTVFQVVVGYTANYAIYVHENLKARHKEGKRAKFLEWVIRTFRFRLKRIVVVSAKQYVASH